MKHYLFSSVLLLAPLGKPNWYLSFDFFLNLKLQFFSFSSSPFANQPFAKFIFSDGYFISESSDAYIIYDRLPTMMKFYFQGDYQVKWQMMIADSNLITETETNVSFVVEPVKVKNLGMSGQNGICNSDSDSELRGLIANCIGPFRLRQLTPEETTQMEEFKSNSKGFFFFFYVSWNLFKFSTVEALFGLTLDTRSFGA